VLKILAVQGELWTACHPKGSDALLQSSIRKAAMLSSRVHPEQAGQIFTLNITLNYGFHYLLIDIPPPPMRQENPVRRDLAGSASEERDVASLESSTRMRHGATDAPASTDRGDHIVLLNLMLNIALVVLDGSCFNKSKAPSMEAFAAKAYSTVATTSPPGISRCEPSVS